MRPQERQERDGSYEIFCGWTETGGVLVLRYIPASFQAFKTALGPTYLPYVQRSHGGGSRCMVRRLSYRATKFWNVGKFSNIRACIYHCHMVALYLPLLLLPAQYWYNQVLLRYDHYSLIWWIIESCLHSIQRTRPLCNTETAGTGVGLVLGYKSLGTSHFRGLGTAALYEFLCICMAANIDIRCYWIMHCWSSRRRQIAC